MATVTAHTSSGARRRSVFVLAAGSLAALLLSLSAPSGAPSEEELEGRAPTAEELRPSVEAAFAQESYAPGSSASLVVFNGVRGFTLQVFHAGPGGTPTHGHSEMQGLPVTQSSPVRVPAGRHTVRVRVGTWPSGLYFARLTAADGRVGFAPFIVRPSRLGQHRVAVVLPTLTWQAYNLRDDNGDGVGDSWYADWNQHIVRLSRPFLNRGVPYNFRWYDLPFLHWLAWTKREVDFLSDSDLDAVPSGRALTRTYDLIVFPGHHEYVTTHEYDVVESYRNRGGNLAFLSANNFFWRVRKHGNTIEKTEQWRNLGRPEASLIGVQYRGNDRGGHRGPWIVSNASSARWFFAGTRLRDGSAFGSGGIEIDKAAAASPRGVKVLAEIPNLFGPGFTAQMTYYETSAGAKVFAAGAFRFGGSVLCNPTIRKLMDNLWAHLAQP